MALGAALGLAGAAQGARAIGVAAGEATSPAPLQLFSVDTWLSQSGNAKAQQRAGSLSIQGATRVETLLDESLAKLDASWSNLDLLIEELEAKAAGALPAEAEELRARLQLLVDDREKGRRARALKAQVAARRRVLSRLAAQPAWLVYGSACLASFGSTLVMHPVDTVKTRLMSGGGEGGGGGAEGGAASPRGGAGLGDLGSLYQGLPANLLKEGPPSALYLGIYEAVKGGLLPNGGVFPAAAGAAASSSHAPLVLAPLVVYLVAGAAGEFVGSAVRAPSEAAKTRVQSGAAASTGEAFAQLARDPAATANTWAASLLRDVPFGAVQIALFEGTKTAILESPAIDWDVNTLAAEALLGGFAGAVAAALTTPADVVVTRLITQPGGGEEEEEEGGGGLAAAPTPRLGVLGMARQIYAEGGAGAFLLGTGNRVAYWAPAIAIFLSLYCRLRSLGLDIFPQ